MPNWRSFDFSEHQQHVYFIAIAIFFVFIWFFYHAKNTSEIIKTYSIVNCRTRSYTNSLILKILIVDLRENSQLFFIYKFQTKHEQTLFNEYDYICVWYVQFLCICHELISLKVGRLSKFVVLFWILPRVEQVRGYFVNTQRMLLVILYPWIQPFPKGMEQHRSEKIHCIFENSIISFIRANDEWK